jgi:hypothetical protein
MRSIEALRLVTSSPSPDRRAQRANPEMNKEWRITNKEVEVGSRSPRLVWRQL